MELTAGLLCIVVLFSAWLYTVRKFSTFHVALRHLLGLSVGTIAMLVAFAIFIFIGAITPQGKNATTAESKIDPSAALLQSLTPAAKVQVSPESEPQSEP